MKFTWLLALVLVGCNEYTAQICTEDVRKDVPGFEGNRTLVSYNAEAFQVASSVAKIQRIATGVYLATGKREALYTCELGGKTWMEQQNEAGRWQNFLLTKSDKGFDITITFFDKAKLDAAGIPYTIVETNHSTPFGKWEGTKTLIVDNSAIANPKVVAEHLHGSSFLIRMY